MKALKYFFITILSLVSLIILTLVIAGIVIDENDIKRWIAETSSKQYGRELVIKGDLDVDLISSQPQIVAHDITLANPEWAQEPYMAEFDKFLLQLRLWPLLKGSIQILDTELVNGKVLLIEQAERNNWDELITEQEPSEEEGYFSIEEFNNASIRNLSVTYQNKPMQENHRLKIDTFTAENLFSPQRRADMSGSLDDMSIGLQMSQKSVAAEAADRLFKLVGHVGNTDAYFTGDVSDTFDTIQGRLRLKGPGNTLTKIVRAAGVDVGALHDFDGFTTLDADLSAPGVKLTEISIKYGQSQANGRLEASLAGAVPSINGDLTFPKLTNADLKSLGSGSVVKELKEEVTDVSPGAKEGQSETKKLFDEDPLGTVIPANLQLNFQVAIKDYTADNWTRVIKGGEAQLSLKNQQLTMSPLIIRMMGGAAAVDGELSQVQDLLKGDLRLRAESIELGRIATELVNLDDQLQAEKIIGGAMDAVADLKFSGASPQTIAASLDGDVSLAMSDGYVGSLFVEALEFDITEAVTSWFADNPKTEIKCMVAKFNITAGTIDSRSVTVNTADSDVLGSGQVNLAKETVDFDIIAKAKDYSITGNPVTFSIEGDVLNPRLDIGGNDSLLEEAGEALVAPVVNTFQEVFGDNRDEVSSCKRFESQIANIQQKARISLAD